MRITKSLNLSKIDPFLLIALISGFVFCIYGINWGRVEEWNPDQMVFRKTLALNKIITSPEDFFKPPFHTYFNFLFSYLPLKLIEKILHLPDNYLTSGSVILIWCRILTVFLFLGSIVLIFKINQRFFSLFTARVITLIFTTSSGFAVYSHFLTTDIPVTFWMLLSFYFIQSIYLQGKVSDYVLAGLFTGISTATKYNGLSIGIGIVVAHILSFDKLAGKKILSSSKLMLSLLAVVFGFILANPFALINYHKFISDFLYNYTVTPVYDGNITGNNYFNFFAIYLREILGLPSLIVLIIAIISSLYITFASKEQKNIRAMLIPLAIFLIYYYKFGEFPRLDTRFILPIVPFCLILSGAFWDKLKFNKAAVSVILVIILSYNTVCSLYVGKRFLEDPRMMAQEWVKQNIPTLSSMESSAYIPRWNLLSGVKLKSTSMPFISGRGRLFEETLKNQSQKNWWINDRLQETQKSDKNLSFYSKESLLKRNPEYIAINSLYYERFFNNEQIRKFYPEILAFFDNLINEKYSYKRVFDRETKTLPFWIYPQDIDFLKNRTIIFARKDS